MKKNKIVIADDDPNIRYAFIRTFENEPYEVIEASNGREALNAVEKFKPHILFLDLSMPELDGFGVMEALKERNIDIPVIMITGFGSMQTAIKAIQLGAYEYITKPLDIDRILILAQRALEVYELKRKVEGLESQASSIASQFELVGNHPKMQEIYKTIGAVTETPNSTSVLICGESGTGKELVARAIHNHGAFKDQPFVGINCTVLPETLMESELFGHEKGAFTGAIEQRIGKFESARSGTIFLDEIADISPQLQQKLLRVLQERHFERIGSNNSISVEARFIASTNKNLKIEIAEGRFREDLYYRLNVITIEMPPLRERKDDIPILAEIFLKRYAAQIDKDIVRFDGETRDLLIRYDYPGNVRELENIVKSAVIQEKSTHISPSSLPTAVGESSEMSGFSFPKKMHVWEKARSEMLKIFEKQYFSHLLKQTSGNVTQASKLAGIERESFQRIMKKHNLSSADFKHRV